MLHRDPRYFPNPEVYQPERFLSNSQKPPPFAYIPFSAGSRNCIGWKFATMVVKASILSILRAYRIESVDSPDQLRLISSIVLINKYGIRIKISPRQNDNTSTVISESDIKTKED